MQVFQDIRRRVMGMESEDCRQELADTLEALDCLEGDVAMLCQMVMLSLAQHPVKDRPDVRGMIERLGNRNLASCG